MSFSTSTIGPPVGDPAFEGYFLDAAGQPSRIACGDGSKTFVTTASYGSCCANSACSSTMITSCSDSVAYAIGASNAGTCPSGNRCSTATISPTFPINPSATGAIYLVGCFGNYWSQNTIYQTVLRVASVSVTASSSSSASSRQSSTQPSTSESASDSKSSSSSSKAWIAGPVIGALVLLALLIGGIIYVMKLKRRHNSDLQTMRQSQAGIPTAYVDGLHSTSFAAHNQSTTTAATTNHFNKSPASHAASTSQATDASVLLASHELSANGQSHWSSPRSPVSTSVISEMA